MAAEQGAVKLKVFVSYSHDDSSFADEVVAGLEWDGGFDITIDRHSIEQGEDWKARLGALIEAADTIVFVLSPASAMSEHCRWEVERAAELSKRILTVLHLPIGDIAPPPGLGRIHYVDFTIRRPLIAGIRDLSTALRKDLGWLREAARLLNRALEWERTDRRDNRLLTGLDIVEAKKWLADCPPDEKPDELHRSYIHASEAAEVALLDVERTRLDAERVRAEKLAAAESASAKLARRVAVRTVAGLAVAVMLAFAAACAAWLAWGQAERARLSERSAEATTREAQITQSGLLSRAAKLILDQPSGDAPLAMLLALESMPDIASYDARQARRPRVGESQIQLDRGYFDSRESAVLPHDDLVRTVAWSPDGRLLTTGSNDKMARIVEAATGRLVRQLEHADYVTVVAWSPDGRLLATASNDKTALIVEVVTGRLIGKVEHNDGVRTLAWSPDGRTLTSWSENSKEIEVQIFDVPSRNVIDRKVYAGALQAPWGKEIRLLAIGSRDRAKGEVQIIDAATGRELTRVALEDRVSAVEGSPDARLIAIVSSDKTVRIVEAATGAVVRQIEHKELVDAVAWSRDGRLLAITSADKHMQFVDVASGERIAHVGLEGRASEVTWRSDGRLIAILLDDNTARIVEVSTGREIARTVHEGSVLSVAWSPDGRLLATGSYDKTARILKIASEKGTVRWLHEGWVHAVAWSPDGRMLATGSGDQDGEAQIIEAATGSVIFRKPHKGGVRAVAWSPDGRMLATGSGDPDGEAQFIEAATGSVIFRRPHEGWVHAVAWSPDGRMLATGSGDYQDGEAQIIEAATGSVIFRRQYKGGVRAVAWSPDGRMLATGANDNTARVVEMPSGKQFPPVVHAAAVNSLAWSPDGRLLATGSGDEFGPAGGFRIVEAATGKEIARSAIDYWVWAVAWSSDGRLLATGAGEPHGYRGVAQIIEAATGKEIKRVAHDGPVVSVAWSPDGAAMVPAILSGSSDKTARLLQVIPTAEELVKAAKERATRCLTPQQRQQYFLPPAPPTWCAERRLWPYHRDAWQAWLPKQKAWLANGRVGQPPELPK